MEQIIYNRIFLPLGAYRMNCKDCQIYMVVQLLTNNWTLNTNKTIRPGHLIKSIIKIYKFESNQTALRGL